MRLCRIGLMPETTAGGILMQDENKYFKVISLLLQYPDDAYFGALPELKSAVDEMHRGRCRAAIEAFIADLEARSGFQLQERYTALFDMSPSTTLNMTYHLWGDGEKRARLLTRLQQEYACADLAKNSPELPDFLPLILEFLAAVPRAKRSDTIQKSLAGIDTLVERLKPIAAPYARLLEPLAGMFKEQANERTAAGVN
jgi:nitrate reductase delta subunit